MKKWDIKSIITLALVFALIVITIGLILAVIFKVLPTDDTLINSVILLFSNCTTMVMTYFFTKKKDGGETDNGNN